MDDEDKELDKDTKGVIKQFMNLLHNIGVSFPVSIHRIIVYLSPIMILAIFMQFFKANNQIMFIILMIGLFGALIKSFDAVD